MRKDQTDHFFRKMKKSCTTYGLSTVLAVGSSITRKPIHNLVDSSSGCPQDADEQTTTEIYPGTVLSASSSSAQQSPGHIREEEHFESPSNLFIATSSSSVEAGEVTGAAVMSGLECLSVKSEEDIDTSTSSSSSASSSNERGIFYLRKQIPQAWTTAPGSSHSGTSFPPLRYSEHSQTCSTRRSRRVQHASLPHSQAHKIRRQPTKLSRAVSITENHQGFVMQLNQYEIRREIGRGAFGLVKLAYDTDQSHYYAMKILSKSRLRRALGLFRRMPLRDSDRSNNPRCSSSASPSPLRVAPGEKSSPNQNGGRFFPVAVDPLHRIYQEIAILKKLDHPNVVKLVEVLDDPVQDNLYMVFEYVENGPVMVVGEDPPLSELQTWLYFRDTVLGLEYLHFHKIIHRDIKPANLLLSTDGHIKIADFGVSNEFSHGEDVLLHSTLGTPAFLAPESVMQGVTKFSGKPMDIWALGVSLFCFLFGLLPFNQTERFALYHAIVNDPIVFPASAQPVSEEVIDLLQQTLTKNPHDRITLQGVKEHPWVTRCGEFPLPLQEANCADGILEVTEADLCNCVRFIPRLETLICVKIILKRRSFRNPMLSRRAAHAPGQLTD